MSIVTSSLSIAAETTTACGTLGRGLGEHSSEKALPFAALPSSTLQT